MIPELKEELEDIGVEYKSFGDRMTLPNIEKGFAALTIYEDRLCWREPKMSSRGVPLGANFEDISYDFTIDDVLEIVEKFRR